MATGAPSSLRSPCCWPVRAPAISSKDDFAAGVNGRDARRCALNDARTIGRHSDTGGRARCVTTARGLTTEPGEASSMAEKQTPLHDHADGITNVAVHQMEIDIRQAARVLALFATLKFRFAEITEMALSQAPAGNRPRTPRRSRRCGAGVISPLAVGPDAIYLRRADRHHRALVDTRGLTAPQLLFPLRTCVGRHAARSHRIRI
jgi:hypothetical protein